MSPLYMTFKFLSLLPISHSCTWVRGDLTTLSPAPSSCTMHPLDQTFPAPLGSSSPLPSPLWFPSLHVELMLLLLYPGTTRLHVLLVVSQLLVCIPPILWKSIPWTGCSRPLPRTPFKNPFCTATASSTSSTSTNLQYPTTTFLHFSNSSPFPFISFLLYVSLSYLPFHQISQ